MLTTHLVKAGTTTAAYKRAYFYCVDSTDGITPETGEAGGQPQISIDGGAFTASGIGTLASIGNGRYYADLSDSTVSVAGRRVLTRYKSANTTETVGTSFLVTEFNPYTNEVAGDVIGNVIGNVGGSVQGNLNGNITGSVASVAAGGISSTSFATGAITNAALANDVVTSSKLASGCITSAKLANDTITGATLDASATAEIVSAVLTSADAVEAGYSVKGAMQIILASAAGLVSGAGTTTVTFRNPANTTNRIVGTVDAVGNRSAITTTHD